MHLLTFNKSIESLDVGFNQLGSRRDEGLIEVAEALGKNATLKHLALGGNGMSDDAARKFVAVIDEHGHG